MISGIYIQAWHSKRTIINEKHIAFIISTLSPQSSSVKVTAYTHLRQDQSQTKTQW